MSSVAISNEAVEAAVKAWDHHWGDRYGDEAVEEMGEEVRVALEAAAPHIIAGALCDGSALCPSPAHIEGCFRTNPDYAK